MTIQHELRLESGTEVAWVLGGPGAEKYSLINDYLGYLADRNYSSRSPREAELLDSTTAMPMLRLNRRSVDTEDRPIEVVRSLYRGDRVAFEALLTDR